MILFVESPAAIIDSITAATTAGRVPLVEPGPQKTFTPTMSWLESKLRQALLAVDLPVT
jgi:hypothetical protein